MLLAPLFTTNEVKPRALDIPAANGVFRAALNLTRDEGDPVRSRWQGMEAALHEREGVVQACACLLANYNCRNEIAARLSLLLAKGKRRRQHLAGMKRLRPDIDVIQIERANEHPIDEHGPFNGCRAWVADDRSRIALSEGCADGPLGYGGLCPHRAERTGKSVEDNALGGVDNVLGQSVVSDGKRIIGKLLFDGFLLAILRPPRRGLNSRSDDPQLPNQNIRKRQLGQGNRDVACCLHGARITPSTRNARPRGVPQ